MFVNIKYLRVYGVDRTAIGGYYVLEFPQFDWLDGAERAAAILFQRGFTRKNVANNTSYDEEEIIAPGAILSVSPCDSRGYTKHALDQIKEEQSR